MVTGIHRVYIKNSGGNYLEITERATSQRLKKIASNLCYIGSVLDVFTIRLTAALALVVLYSFIR